MEGFVIRGRCTEAVVYALQLDEIAQAQILELCCQEFARDAHIRIMPDAHAGAGCVIGTTMAVSDRIAPSLVGVDIGCGMEAVKLSDMEANMAITRIRTASDPRIVPYVGLVADRKSVV